MANAESARFHRCSPVISGSGKSVKPRVSSLPSHPHQLLHHLLVVKGRVIVLKQVSVIKIGTARIDPQLFIYTSAVDSIP